MKNYKINELFYSLQGEGFHTGTPAVFVRFSGCNLRCPFCDTRHGSGQMMSLEEIVSAVSSYPASLTVLTGGEPSLFVDEALVEALHAAGKRIAIETNGTNPLPEGIDWVTLSPKFGLGDVWGDGGAGAAMAGGAWAAVCGAGAAVADWAEKGRPSGAEPAEIRISGCDELKVVYTGQDMSVYSHIRAAHRFVQSCDTSDPDRNRELLCAAVEFCKANPEWRLSLQTHKFIGIR